MEDALAAIDAKILKLSAELEKLKLSRQAIAELADNNAVSDPDTDTDEDSNSWFSSLRRRSRNVPRHATVPATPAIPARPAPAPAQAPAPAPAPAPASSRRRSVRQVQFVQSIEDGVVNINTATLLELQQLNGVGPTIAQNIINARPFMHVADLHRVYGIGDRKYHSLERYICV